MKAWTPDECRLLRYVAVDIGACVSSPESALSRWREGNWAGGALDAGIGYRWAFGKTALEGSWATGSKRDAGYSLTSVRIDYRRILRWVDTLPADIRDRARTHYRTWPENTRNLTALHALVLELIPNPGPLPVTAADLEPPRPRRRPIREVHLPPMPGDPDHHPADLLELLEMTA